MNYIIDDNTKYFTEFIECIKNLQNKIPIQFQHSNMSNIIFQTEQLTRKFFFDIIIKYSYKNIILDYSMYNISLIKNFNNNSKTIICPIFFTDNMFFNINIKKYDIVFIGHLSHRRQHILNELLIHGYTILIIQNEYDFYKKYDLICSAKILVNIHAYDDYRVFEFARCSIPIYNKVIVISEECEGVYEELKNPINKFIIEHSIIVDYENIVKKCINELVNYKEPIIDYNNLRLISNQEILRINTELKEYEYK